MPAVREIERIAMPQATASFCVALGMSSCAALFQEYGAIYFGAIWGAFFAISRIRNSRARTWLWMFGSIGFSVVFTGIIARVFSVVTGFDIALLLAPVAFWLAFKSDGAAALFDELSTTGIRKWFRGRVDP